MKASTIQGLGTVGLITYMRTDSLRVSDEAVAAAKKFIGGRWGESYVNKTARKWKSRSATAAQDAHEAIRPSMPELTPRRSSAASRATPPASTA